MLRSDLALPLLAVVFLSSAPAQAQWTVGTPLTEARGRLSAVTLGDLAFFAGGEDAGSTSSTAPNSDVVDVYDAATDTWTVVHLTQARSRLAGTRIGAYVLFGGGGIDSSTPLNDVDIFDASLNKTTATLSVARAGLLATTAGNRALFAGGATALGPAGLSDVVDVYDSTLGLPDNPAAWSATTMPNKRVAFAVTSVGDLALFAGGQDLGGVLATVDVYDASTGLWSSATLSEARSSLSAATVGTRAYFVGGGVPMVSVSDRIDIYDASKGPPSDPNAWDTATLPAAVFGLKPAVLGNSLILAGGGTATALSKAVFRLNVGTGHWDSGDQLSLERFELGAAAVGGKALFAGGVIDFVGNATAVDDVYEPVGINYCQANTNSTGCAATISVSGSTSLAANDLTLTTTCVPDAPFLYIHSLQQSLTPFGDSYLCLGGMVKRIQPGGLATGGVAQATVDLPTEKIDAPGPRNFQCWYRDPAAAQSGFSTSDALTVTFVP